MVSPEERAESESSETYYVAAPTHDDERRTYPHPHHQTVHRSRGVSIATRQL